MSLFLPLNNLFCGLNAYDDTLNNTTLDRVNVLGFASRDYAMVTGALYAHFFRFRLRLSREPVFSVSVCDGRLVRMG